MRNSARNIKLFVLLSQVENSSKHLFSTSTTCAAAFMKSQK